MPSAAVGGSPSATDGENFAVCLISLCRVLGAHGKIANSGSVIVCISRTYFLALKLLSKEEANKLFHIFLVLISFFGKIKRLLLLELHSNVNLLLRRNVCENLMLCDIKVILHGKHPLFIRGKTK